MWSAATGLSDLGTLGGTGSVAYAIDDAGRVVGESHIAGSRSRAFSWTSGGGMVDLGTLGGNYSGARGVNQTGQSVGSASPEAMIALNMRSAGQAGGGMVSLGTLGGTNSWANDVNDAVWWWAHPLLAGDPVHAPYHAFARAPGAAMKDLGTLGGPQSSGAAAVNNAGQVVGWAQNAAGEQRAVIWSVTIAASSPEATPRRSGAISTATAETELHVFRPSNGTWYVRYSALGYAGNDTFQWGLPGDIPISADFDGDGKIELTVYRPGDSTWYIRFSTHGYAAGGAQAVQWGLPGDVPVVADFDGDGRSELTVYRPSNGTWYIRFSTHGYSVGGAQELQWGLAGDLPIGGDFDGDGRTDLTVFRPANGTWYVRYSSLNYSTADRRGVPVGVAGRYPAGDGFRRRRQSGSHGLPAGERPLVHPPLLLGLRLV